MKKVIKNQTRTIVVFIFLFILIIPTACNKSKYRSRKLDGDKWIAKEMTVDGVAETSPPELLFKECDIYKESCSGTWITPDGGRGQFAWQFRNKGKEFELSNQTDHVHSIEDVKAGEQCIKYTGVYTVIESKFKSLVIESKITSGFTGKKVKIEFEKKD